jgi:hypothetical protein
MQRTRAEFEFDRETVSEPTDFETSENRFELLCGMCGAAVYVDRATFDRLNAAVEQGLRDNPLICGECETAFDEERLAD